MAAFLDDWTLDCHNSRLNATQRGGSNDLDCCQYPMGHDLVGRSNFDHDLRRDRAGGSSDFYLRETLDGPLADLIVRNWGVPITLVGAMIIYGAFDPQQRPLVLIVAGVSKAVFIALVLSQGQRYLGHQAVIAVMIHLLMIGLFSWYLLAATIARRKVHHGA